MTITEDVTHYTPEAYLVRERTAEARGEYRDGDIHAMEGASRAHNLIAGNTFAQLRRALRSRPCETYMNDMRVKVANLACTPTRMSSWSVVSLVSRTVQATSCSTQL
ncbi:MAG: hypothetical protein R2856_27695 [Caldilineaceae bacterium]